MVVLLHQEQDLELLGRIVEPAQVLDQAADDVRLVVDRHEHRVERQLVVGHAGGGDVPRAAAGRADAGQRRDELEEHAEHERGLQHDHRPDHEAAVVEHARRDDPGRGEAQPDALAAARPAECRAQRVALGQAVGGVVAQLVGEQHPDRGQHVPVGRGREGHGDDVLGVARCARRVDVPAQLPRGRLRRRHVQDAAAQLERDPALERHLLGVEHAGRRHLGRRVHEVDEPAAPQLGQHRVERLATHEPGGQQHAAEPLARAPVRGERPGQLLGGQEAALDERVSQRLARPSPRGGRPLGQAAALVQRGTMTSRLGVADSLH